MLESLIVMIGGSFGAVCRFAVSSFIKKAFSTEFPISTLFINVAGCFLMGGLLASHPGNLDQLLLGTGFLGGFTTFSTFEMENVTLFQQKEYGKLSVYVLCSCVISVFAVFLGAYAGHAFYSSRI
ncbi:fluoride efflux transporter CrcB [Aminipila luticellarii]|uniref:Fluoride-specific ion channel FluC n=1 Tax=Aminipila luticellarii TaxID=2507160 RepID=A0A410PWS6_9FIRM|nr:fluoride efflux transporter CrcB [Aminipila luticellarii]QAT43412.1 fluoride efflux transporter CrcB [Aminipila luticellarii]